MQTELTRREGAGGRTVDRTDRKPNIIYILADDMGYGDISAFNEKCPFTTPNLDLMCERGMRFTDAHATAAVCTPSRYGFLTGRYNWRSVLKSEVIGGYSAPILEEGRTTVASMLQSQGYRTCMVGKWHLGMDFAKTEGFYEKRDFAACDGVDYAGSIKGSPTEHGFDYYYGISGSLDMPPYIYIENNRFTALPDRVTKGTGKKFWREGPTAPDFIHENVLDDFCDKVLEKIEEYREAPFFIYFAMPAPHAPILPAGRFLGKSGTNEYGDFVLHCDDVVGRISRKLEETGLLENTILAYASDNGCSPFVDFQELKAKGHSPSYHFRGAKAGENQGRQRIRRSGMPVRFPGDHSGLPGRRAEGKRGGGQCKQPPPVDGGTNRSAPGYRASEHRRLPVHSKGEMEAGDVSGIRWLVLP